MLVFISFKEVNRIFNTKLVIKMQRALRKRWKENFVRVGYYSVKQYNNNNIVFEYLDSQGKKQWATEFRPISETSELGFDDSLPTGVLNTIIRKVEI